MGVNASVYCARCRVAAPPVGDWGHIGYPTLVTAPSVVDGIPTFGWIHEALDGLGMVTLEVDAIGAFLRKHRGHAVRLWLDGNGSDPGRLRETPRPTAGKAFANGTYVLRCKCGETCRSSADVVVRWRGPVRIDPEDLARLRQRLIAKGRDAFYRIGDALLINDPPRFEAFLRVHTRHGVMAHVETSDDWMDLPPAGRRRPRSRNVHSRTGDAAGAQPTLTLSPPLKYLWHFDRDSLAFPEPYPDGVLVLSSSSRPAAIFLELDGRKRWVLPGKWDVVCRDPLIMDRSVWRFGAEIRRDSELHLVDLRTGRTRPLMKPTHHVAHVLPAVKRYVGTRRVDDSNDYAVALLRLERRAPPVWEVTCRREGHISDHGPGLGRPVVYGSRVYVELAHRFVALRLADGKSTWEVDLDPFGGPAGTDHRVARPAVAAGLVVASTARGTLALDAKTGRRIWDYENGRYGRVVTGDRVITWWNVGEREEATTRWNVLELRTGRMLAQWSFLDPCFSEHGRRPVWVWAKPVVTDRYILFGDTTGRFWALDRETGRPVWKTRPPDIQSAPFGSPGVLGARIYFGRWGVPGEVRGRIYCYEEAGVSGVTARPPSRRRR